MWREGETIVRREVLNDGRVWLEAPVTVVRDEPGLLATHLAEGAPFRFPPGPWPTPDGRHPWHGRAAWQGHGVLMLQRPDEMHAIWHFWDGRWSQNEVRRSGCDRRVRDKDAGSPDSGVLSGRPRTQHRAAERGRATQHHSETTSCPERRFRGWYVNFQEPFRRTEHGYDTQDLELDIWIPADGPWGWKDAEEVDVRVREGRLTAKQAELVRAEGARVAAELDAGRRWWSPEWANWTPEPR